jgi:DNA (cytosine-5)-methyltransferase 1
VRDLRPRWFLFENVKGIAQSKTSVASACCSSCDKQFIVPFADRESLMTEETGLLTCPVCTHRGQMHVNTVELRGGSLEIILHEFESLGYKCQNKLLNAADFGAPQSRERLMIVGSRDGERFRWPTPTHANSSSISSSGAQLQLEMDAPKKQWTVVQDVLWRSGHPDFGPLDYKTAVLWVKNVVRPHDEPVTWGLDRPSPTVGAHQAAKLALAPLGVPPEQLLRQQWHTLGRRQGDNPPVHVIHAYLSDEELLRLQTFPASWYLHGTRMERAFQIGNAVPPLLAEAVGRAILQASSIKPKASMEPAFA